MQNRIGRFRRSGLSLEGTSAACYGRRVGLLAWATLLAALAPTVVHAQGAPYTFKKISDAADVEGTQCLAVGNSGRVIFQTGSGLWRGDGQAARVLVASDLGGVACAINDLDELAYIVRGGPPLFPDSLVRDTNGVRVTLATSTTSPYLHSGSRTFVSLSNDGSASFQGDSTACGNPGALSGSGIYIGGPGAAIVYDPICHADAQLNSSTVHSGTMNNSRVVVFNAQTIGGIQGIYRGSLTPLVQHGNQGVSLTGPYPLVINDAGRVAFVASINGTAGIYTTLDGVSFTQAGPIPIGNANFSINDSGTVVYRGPDNAIHAGMSEIVIAPDEPLDDGCVFASAHVFPRSLNDHGQIAFMAFLTCATEPTGRWAIYRADPNRPPQAQNGTLTVAPGSSATGGLSASDPDGDALTYEIVANGTKGTAVINNTATGAYTYTAQAGSSGTDTFTFRASDGHRFSNTATVTVTIEPSPPSCAVDVTASLSVTLGGYRVDRKTPGRYFQKVTVKNTSGNVITGPVSFVLDSLSSGTTVVGAAGVTSWAAPEGSPYVAVDIGSDGLLGSRERANIAIEFTLELAGAGPPSYVPRVLAGPGGR